MTVGTTEKTKLTPQDEKLLRLEREGSVEEFCDALLEHPVKGRLLRVLAQEDAAPEHHEFMKRYGTGGNGAEVEQHGDRDAG